MQRYATSRSTERSLKIAHVIAALRQITLKERVLASHTATSDNAFIMMIYSLSRLKGAPQRGYLPNHGQGNSASYAMQIKSVVGGLKWSCL